MFVTLFWWEIFKVSTGSSRDIALDRAFSSTLSTGFSWPIKLNFKKGSAFPAPLSELLTSLIKLS